MSDYVECALPKSESGWMGGVQMKDANQASQKRVIERFRRELEQIPEPNFGRIQELRDKIKKKTLLTRESIEEAAERLAERFLGRE